MLEMNPTSPFFRRPWLFVVLAFVVLIVAWTTLITIAVKNSPEVVPVPPPDSSQP
jgi:hypothetical protein